MAVKARYSVTEKCRLGGSKVMLQETQIEGKKWSYGK
jgi:hypothetical protein